MNWIFAARSFALRVATADSRFPPVFPDIFIDFRDASSKNRLMDQPKFRPARLTPSAPKRLPI
jgi:hypothetical protein